MREVPLRLPKAPPGDAPNAGVEAAPNAGVDAAPAYRHGS